MKILRALHHAFARLWHTRTCCECHRCVIRVWKKAYQVPWIYLGRVCNDVIVCRVWRCGNSRMTRKSPKTRHVISCCCAHAPLPVGGEAVKAGDEVKFLMRVGGETKKKTTTTILGKYVTCKLYWLIFTNYKVKDFKNFEWVIKWMVQNQSTLTGRTINFWAHTSLHQPQRNALFSRTPVNQSFFDRHKGHRGPGLYYTIKDLWQSLWDISWNVYN